jgi:hypothetical protein
MHGDRWFSICLLLLISTVTGCQDNPIRVEWKHLQRNADLLGEERFFFIQAVDASDRVEDSAVIISGIVVREVHVDIWNVYESIEYWNPPKSNTRRLVADPIGKPLSGADSILTPASIKGIDRAPVGPQWERADYAAGPPCQVRWEITLLKKNNAVISSGVANPTRSGQVVLRIDGQALKDTAYLPVADIDTVVTITGPTTDGVNRIFGKRRLVLPRKLFVDALDNAR